MKATGSFFARSALAGLGLAAMLLPASAADPGVTDNEIAIGLFAPLSGSLAAFGIDALNAAKMIYDEANKAGGIHGRKIRVVVEDDKCNPNETNAVAQKLLTVDKVFLLNGGSCTAATVSIQGLVTRLQVPHVMLNASGDPGVFPPTRYVFGSFGGTQGAAGSGMMQFAIETLKAKKVAYVTSDDDYGAANFAAAKAVANRAGVAITTLERIPNNIVDVTSTMLRVRDSNPDVIISAAYPQGAVLIAQARQSYGMTQPLIQSTQGVTSPDAFAKNVGDKAALKDFYYSSAVGGLPDDPKMKGAYDRYKAAFPDRTNISTYMVLGLQPAIAIVQALQKAGKDLTREKFVDAMETVSFEAPEMAKPIAFSKTRRDAERGQIIIKFDGTTNTVVGSYEWDGSRAE